MYIWFCRIFGALVGLMNGTLAGFGFSRGKRLYNNDHETEAMQTYVLSTYLLMFAVLSILAEIRHDGTLKPFRFLKYAIGRGFFYLMIGSSLIVVYPDLKSTLWCGIVTAICGACNFVLMFPCFPNPSSKKKLADKGPPLSQQEAGKDSV